MNFRIRVLPIKKLGMELFLGAVVDTVEGKVLFYGTAMTEAYLIQSLRNKFKRMQHAKSHDSQNKEAA